MRRPLYAIALLSLRSSATAVAYRPAIAMLSSTSQQGRGGRPAAAPRPQKAVHVVTSFVRRETVNGDRFLLVKRSPEVGSYVGRWGGVSGTIEEGKDEGVLEAGLREIEEEVGLPSSCLEVEQRGRPFRVESDRGDKLFIIHPLLLRYTGGKESEPEVKLNWENTEYEWAHRERFQALNTVPRLLDALDRVYVPLSSREGVAYLVADRMHGASELTLEAVSILRRTAEELVGTGRMVDIGAMLLNVSWLLIQSRPSMRASIAHGVFLFMKRLGAIKGSVRDPLLSQADVEEAFSLARDDHHEALNVVGRAGAEELARRGCTRILTHSLSHSVRCVLRSLMEMDPERSGLRIYFTESRPLMEGAKQLADVCKDASCLGIPLDPILITDAQAGVFIESDCDAVLLGCDGITVGGNAVNKVGSSLVAMAAKRAGVPVFVATDTSKTQITPLPEEVAGSDASSPEHFVMEEPDASEMMAALPGELLLEHKAQLRNVYFEEIGSDLIDMYFTELGALQPQSLLDIAREKNSILADLFSDESDTKNME